MKNIFIVLFILNCSLLFGQNCDCQKEFEFLVKKIENDYAGFSDKVNSQSKKDYIDFTKNLRKKVKAITTFRKCAMVLDDWLKFFEDKHLHLSWTENIYFTYKRIDENAVLLRIPNFSWEQKGMIDSLIKSNYKEITSTPILIIDLRGNGGGTDYSYVELLPLIYTNSYESKGVEWWASKGNINYFENAFKKGNIKKGMESDTKKLIDSLKAHPNSFVSIDKSDIITMDTVLKTPRFVGIIVDDFCASSCEQFVLSAKHSSKTTIFGTQTLGVLDYSNVVPDTLVTKNFNIYYPMTRSSRLPEEKIDNIGIKPDVEINLPVNLNVKSTIDEWVVLVNNYLKNKLKE